MLHTVGFTSSDSFKCLENLKKGAVDLCLTIVDGKNAIRDIDLDQITGSLMYFISWNPEAEFLRWMAISIDLTGGEAF